MAKLCIMHPDKAFMEELATEITSYEILIQKGDLATYQSFLDIMDVTIKEQPFALVLFVSEITETSITQMEIVNEVAKAFTVIFCGPQPVISAALKHQTLKKCCFIAFELSIHEIAVGITSELKIYFESRSNNMALRP